MELELAKLGLQAPPEDDFDVNTLPTIVRTAQEEKNAKSKLTRRRNLKQFTTAEDLDQTETDFKIAEANHQQAVLEASATLAAVRQRQAVLDTALDRLNETSIRVPEPSVDRLQEVMQAARAAGLKQEELPPVEYVVSERMVSEGEMIHAASGAAVFHLVMDRPLKLLATVPERHVGEVRIGQPVEVAVEAYPADTFQGVVSRINPTIDRASRTFKLEVLVANPDRRLKAGSFAKASVMTREDAQAPTIPEEALVSFAGVTKVFVIEGGQARAIEVQPGVRMEIRGAKRPEHWVEIAGDLPAAAEVATSGQTQLADGTAVRLRSDSPNASPVPPAEQARTAKQRKPQTR
jgi:RND family efflux transporter MFP subunit